MLIVRWYLYSHFGVLLWSDHIGFNISQSAVTPYNYPSYFVNSLFQVEKDKRQHFHGIVYDIFRIAATALYNSTRKIKKISKTEVKSLKAAFLLSFLINYPLQLKYIED